MGPCPLGPGEIAAALGRHLSSAPARGAADTVPFSIRLPRVAAAALVGAAPAAAYQAIFRIPLVSPDILGVSTGAGRGAALGIPWGLPVAAIQRLGFDGGIATVAAVAALTASLRGPNPIPVIVLCGVVVGAFAGAALSMVEVLASPEDQLPAITFWLLGSLAGALGFAPLIVPGWRMACCRRVTTRRALGVGGGVPARPSDRRGQAGHGRRGDDLGGGRLGRPEGVAQGAVSGGPALRPAHARLPTDRGGLPDGPGSRSAR